MRKQIQAFEFIEVDQRTGIGNDDSLSRLSFHHAGPTRRRPVPTVRAYLDLLVDAMMLRRLEPFHINIGKRLVKAPKAYLRDSGLLHALLGIDSADALAGHPVAGHSWEGFVLAQIIAGAPPLAGFGFYRTAAGAELDLVVDSGGRRTAYEVKLSNAPRPARGFWNACEDLGVDRAFVVAPVLDAYPLADNVEVVSPQALVAMTG